MGIILAKIQCYFNPPNKSYENLLIEYQQSFAFWRDVELENAMRKNCSCEYCKKEIIHF